MNGYDFLRKDSPAMAAGLHTLMITAYATPKLAVEAIQAGAMDYIAKPFMKEELLHSRQGLRRAVPVVDREHGIAFADARGESPSTICRELRAACWVAQVGRAGGADGCPGFDFGESGTGKELVAGAKHPC